ncbi:MAG: ABC transporter permease, partial [Vulcanimicrobiaceae bacterium]
NLGAALRRNAVAVASLGVAVGTMVAIAILVGSFRTTVVTWSRETIKADLFVRPLGPTDASYDALLSAGAVARIARVRGVAAADTFRAITIPLHGTLTNLAATDIAAVVRRNKLQLLAGPDPQALARGMPGTDEALASEPFVTRFGLGTGALVPIATPSGNVRLRIVGIYNDYSSDAGILLISERTFARLFRDTNVNSVAIYAKPGIDLLDLRTRVIRAALPARIDVVTTRELRALVVEIFNRTFAVTYALYVIALAIAVMGVVSTLFALVLERKREIGLLRYLGLARGGVRRMVLYEAAAIGGLGGLAGFLIGVPLALLLIDVINRQAFGWLIELHVPYGFLLQALALVVLAALAAGLYPAGIAARIRTADAVRTE